MMRRLTCLLCGGPIQLDRWTRRHYEEKGAPADVDYRRDTYFCTDGCAIAYGVQAARVAPRGLGRLDSLRQRYPAKAVSNA